MVDRSTKRLTFEPPMTPSDPVATTSDACGDGRLANTVSARSATSLGEDAGYTSRSGGLFQHIVAGVVDDHPVAGFCQAFRHGKSHMSQADESDYPRGQVVSH